MFDTVAEAVEKTGADATMIFVPPPFAADAILEAADAGIKTVIAITEGVPVLDMVRVYDVVRCSDSVLIGPNCPGVITPEECKIGIMPGYIHKPGPIGVMSRSRHADLRGRLAAHAAWAWASRPASAWAATRSSAPRSSTCCSMFEADPATEAILMIGEIGGTAEEEAAAFVKEHVTKPVAAFIAGRTAPPGKRMGHAGAIISGGKGTAAEKDRRAGSRRHRSRRKPRRHGRRHAAGDCEEGQIVALPPRRYT